MATPAEALASPNPVAEMVKAWLLKRDRTQASLARAIKVDPNLIYFLCKGESNGKAFYGIRGKNPLLPKVIRELSIPPKVVKAVLDELERRQRSAVFGGSSDARSLITYLEESCSSPRPKAHLRSVATSR